MLGRVLPVERRRPTRRGKRASAAGLGEAAATSSRLRRYGCCVSAKDEERIEEERCGVARAAPTTLASSHLAQSLDALDDACSPEAVQRPRRIWPLKQSDSASARRTLAGITQRNYCLTATLFAAFAAEAFVNNFLEVHDLRSQVSASQYKKIDWGSTYKKYVIGVKLAYDKLFEDGDEVMPAIDELFEVRHKLVHPRPGIGPPVAYMPDPGWRSTYPPTKVARWLVAVAGAAESMEIRCYGFDYNSVPAALIWHGRQIVQDIAAQAEPLPNSVDPPRTSLIELLATEQKARAERLGGLQLTVDELREARLKHAADVGPWDAFTELITRPTAPDNQPPET